jgi:hypothetical protein
LLGGDVLEAVDRVLVRDDVHQDVEPAELVRPAAR